MSLPVVQKPSQAAARLYSAGLLLALTVVPAQLFAQLSAPQPASATTPSVATSGDPQAAAQAAAQTTAQAAPQSGAQAAGTVRGTVADPDNAVIPGATVTLTAPGGKAITGTSAPDGSYALRNVPPGSYSLTITMQGFASFVRQGLRVTGQPLVINAKLAIQDEKQEVTVTENPNTVSVDPGSNASSTVITGKDLDALSDDPDELSDELTALAGPSAGPNGGQIYIDGFTGGQLPPKSSIREIRINQNPFSAQYDRVGYGRIEIFTKPGTDKVHGHYSIQGIDSALNTSSPFLGSANSQPPYYTLYMDGNVSGPINKVSSYNIGGSYRSIQNNTLINPSGFFANSPTSTTLCNPGDLTCTNQGGYPATARAITQPQQRFEISPRYDLAIGEKNTLSIRYQFEGANLKNQGLGTTVLPTAAYQSTNRENEIQVSDTQLVSAKIVNETRFEYQRPNSTQTPYSTAPQVTVQGYFTGGGNNTGISNVNSTHIEVQNYTSIALAKNFIRFGGRLRTTGETLTSNSNANGTFTYSYLLDPCVSGDSTGKIPVGCVNTTTACSNANLTANSGNYYSSYQCGLASQFSVTRINTTNIQARETDAGLYVEDDWKVRPNFTFSYGLRYEAQNNIHSSHDFAPRLSLNFGVPRKGGKTTTVLRAGYGIFYDRFGLGDTLTTVRLNGTNQVQSTYNYPGAACLPTNPAPCTSAGTGTTGLTTVYTYAPNIRSSYNMQTGLGVDQQVGRVGTISVNYINTRGVHEFFSRAYGGPLSNTPTTYDYQFDSGGIFKQSQLLVNGRVNTRNVSLFGFYALSTAHSNSNGADTFLTSPDATQTDYGRAAFNHKNFGVIGGSLVAPYRISISPFLIAQSGTPYNVTTGTDVNQDSQYNDRPYFANGVSGGSSGSCFNASSFVTPPTGATNYKPVPINYCTGPALFTFNMRLGHTWGFGPRTDQAAAGGPGGGPGGGGRGGRGGGGSFASGAAGGGGGRGGFGGATNTGRRYNLTLSGQGFNIFNVIPYANPVSQLTSNRFGQFTSLTGNGQFAQGTAVRRFSLQASLNF
jgi:hypothetical protein